MSTELPESENQFQIGNYRVLRHVAQGGMGAVYRVEDPKSGAHYAMKLAAMDGREGTRFEQIHQVLSHFDHPGIIRSMGCGHTDDGRTYHLFQFVGGTPAQVFAKSMGTPGTPERTTAVITVSIHLAEALQYLHDHNVIHRDVKSANVIVREDKSACLIDFGSAIMPGLPTSLGHFIGTYTYASPEQILGKSVDGRTDIYAMGVLLFRMLTGRKPFDAKDTNLLVDQHLHERPKSVDKWVEGVPPPVVELVLAMLEKDAENRPSQAQVVADILRKA